MSEFLENLNKPRKLTEEERRRNRRRAMLWGAVASSRRSTGFSLTAPVLAWLTGAGDSTPAFSADIDPAALSTDSHHVQVSSTSNFASIAQEVTTTVADIEASLGLAALTTGTWYIRSRLERPAATAASNWSNTLTLAIDVTAPTITSANTANNAENSVLAHSLTANETVTWTITGGADQARFELSGSTLRWASNGTKDYETPNDADTNNTYVVQVTATDTAGNATNQTVTVTVTDVAEGVTFSLAQTDHFVDTAGGTTINYGSRAFAFGAADANRWIIVSVYVRGTSSNPSVTGVTVDGVTATLVGSGIISGGVFQYIADMRSGTNTNTSGIISVTGTGASRSGIRVHRLITATPTATDSQNSVHATNTSLNVTITVPTGGAALGICCSRLSAQGDATWTNATRDAGSDLLIGGFAGVSSAIATAAGSTVISMDWGVNSGDNGLLVSTWGP